jgi:hypothetical protein
MTDMHIYINGTIHIYIFNPCRTIYPTTYITTSRWPTITTDSYDSYYYHHHYYHNNNNYYYHYLYYHYYCNYE